MKNYPAIGIRPVVDSRRMGIRDALEGKVRQMAESAASLIRENVVATLSVTPSWCYPLETIDLSPLTIKAIWGFNGTERPGAVYLASAIAAHNQMKLPCYSIYGRDVQDMEEDKIPEDVAEKILRFARCAAVVGQLKNKSYVGFGAVSMGIMGSFLDPLFYIQYLGMRPEWVDMTEILRRMDQGIYDEEEFQRALAWVKEKMPFLQAFRGSACGLIISQTEILPRRS